MGFWDYAILGLLLLLAALALRYLWHHRGRGGCSGSCGCCTQDCQWRERTARRETLSSRQTEEKAEGEQHAHTP